LQKLSKLGDCLERLKIIDWESFRPIIASVLIRERKSNAGRPLYDCILLFKTIVLQRLYNLSDDQTEYQINDRMSFMRFLGLGLDDKVPDAKTIWLFKDTLTKAGIMEQLFSQFNQMLEDRGIITHKGTIVDATFVIAIG
jgi:transposase